MPRSYEAHGWYARRNGTVRGPFEDECVSRYILLGRIRLNDELSRNGDKWQPVTEFPELLPAELSGLEGWDDYHKLVMARIEYDERISERRRNRPAQTSGRERRSGKERRRSDSITELFRHLLRGGPPNARNREPHNGRQSFRDILLMALLISLVVTCFNLSTR